MRQVLLLAGLALAAVLAACADEVRAPAPEATLDPAATATPAEPEARRTGIPQVDTVLDALFSGDADAVRDLVSFTPTVCAANPQGLGDPPLCHPNEPDGTAVDLFPTGYCHGDYIRPEDMDGTYLALSRLGAQLFAVYRNPDLTFFPGKYIAVYTDADATTPAGGPSAVYISDGRIVGRHTGCSQTAEAFVEFFGLENAVLPPLP